MITLVSGKPQIIGEKLVLMTPGGVGFSILVPKKILNAIAMTMGRSAETTQNEITLYTYSYIREDRFELYGFERMNDLALFEILITVSGLGPKMALGMFEVGGAERIIEAVQNADLGFFSGVPRVGKKLAQKIVIELKGKLGGVKELDLGPKSQNYQDVKDGLLGLGYGETEIDDVLTAMAEEIEEKEIGMSIKIAIQKLAGNMK